MITFPDTTYPRPPAFFRGYLETQGLDLSERSDSFVEGLVNSISVRMDLGKVCKKGSPCGDTCIPRKRKCSDKKEAETSKLAKEAGVRGRAKLIKEKKAERDKKREERRAKKESAAKSSDYVYNQKRVEDKPVEKTEIKSTKPPFKTKRGAQKLQEAMKLHGIKSAVFPYTSKGVPTGQYGVRALIEGERRVFHSTREFDSFVSPAGALKSAAASLEAWNARYEASQSK